MGCQDFLAGTIRVILFGLNFCTLLTGGVLLGCGVYVRISVNKFTDVDDVSAIDVAAYFLIALGCLVVVVSLFGCLGACLQNHVLLAFYFTLMLVLLLLQIAIGILYAVERSEIESQIDEAVKKTIDNYGDGTSSADQAVDAIQELLSCCGYESKMDYNLDVIINLPKSCCQDSPIVCTIANSYNDGCKSKINDFLGSQSMLVIIVVCSVAVFEILTMLAACYLRRRELSDIGTVPYSM
ncbi:hypothetical protein ACHWQZ_G009856 [Mnemiopsis leidyi]